VSNRDRGKYLKVVGRTMASAERKPITGVWGGAPSGVQSPPPEAETLLAFGRSIEAANLPTFLKSGNTENQTFVLSRQCGYRTIPSYTFMHHLVIYGLRNGTLSPRSKLLLFDALQLCCIISGMHDASVVRPFVCGSRLYCG